RRLAFVAQWRPEIRLAVRMRIPETVQCTEARRGQWFVNGRVAYQVGIAVRDGGGVRHELVREFRIEQTRMARAAAMVKQTGDRCDSKIAQQCEPFIRPGPVWLGTVGMDTFPEDRIAQRRDAELGKHLQVIGTLVMSIALELAEVHVIDEIHRAFQAAPKFEWMWRVCLSLVAHRVL